MVKRMAALRACKKPVTVCYKGCGERWFSSNFQVLGKHLEESRLLKSGGVILSSAQDVIEQWKEHFYCFAATLCD